MGQFVQDKLCCGPIGTDDANIEGSKPTEVKTHRGFSQPATFRPPGLGLAGNLFVAFFPFFLYSLSFFLYYFFFWLGGGPFQSLNLLNLLSKRTMGMKHVFFPRASRTH